MITKHRRPMRGTPLRGAQYLDPALLTAAAAEVGAIAKAEGQSVALIGGLAMQVYGSDRLTGDLDVVAYERLTALPYGPPLSFGGEQTQAPNGVPLDIVLRDDIYKPLYDEALERARRVKGLPIPVVLPEYLAAMKMAANRGKDRVDLEFLLSVPGLLDPKRTLRVVRAHLGAYAGDELHSLLQEAVWKASRGRT
jgi:hypothetical protein